jgi:dihydrodipicolinate synthase/N-acetylneuraminate lyase
VAPLVDFYVRSGLDGLLVLGTTGEGILLDPAERRMVAEAFLAAARDRLAIAVHCGASRPATRLPSRRMPRRTGRLRSS